MTRVGVVVVAGDTVAAVVVLVLVLGVVVAALVFFVFVCGHSDCVHTYSGAPDCPTVHLLRR